MCFLTDHSKDVYLLGSYHELHFLVIFEASSFHQANQSENNVGGCVYVVSVGTYK